MLGHEIRAIGFNMSLGSGINMIREPRDGRTFEYKGEDPVLAGTLAGQELKAEKALHIITDVKHYAVNDQERAGTTLNPMLVSGRCGRPTCWPFRLRCERFRTGGDVLLQPHQRRSRLRKRVHAERCPETRLGFKGFVLSDWGGDPSTVKAALAGLDVEHAGERLRWRAVEGGRGERARCPRRG